jgi:hypothetical protein
MSRLFIVYWTLVFIEFLEKVCPLVPLCHCRVVQRYIDPMAPSIHCFLDTLFPLPPLFVYTVQLSMPISSFCIVLWNAEIQAHRSYFSIVAEPTSHLGFWGCKIRRLEGL